MRTLNFDTTLGKLLSNRFGRETVFFVFQVRHDNDNCRMIFLNNKLSWKKIKPAARYVMTMQLPY
jgi:hypothetical protein